MSIDLICLQNKKIFCTKLVLLYSVWSVHTMEIWALKNHSYSENQYYKRKGYAENNVKCYFSSIFSVLSDMMRTTHEKNFLRTIANLLSGLNFQCAVMRFDVVNEWFKICSLDDIPE